MRLSFINKIIVGLLLVTSIIACNNKRVQIPSNKMINNDSTSVDMIKLNQLLIEAEQKEITDYIDASSLKFSPNELGYYIAITNKTTGKSINKNDLVQVSYQVETLTGDTCYNYTGKLKQLFAVGKLEKQRGFNDALTHLSEGEKAIIIVPSNLAYGAIGDLKNIPPRATLIYTIYSIKINP